MAAPGGPPEAAPAPAPAPAAAAPAAAGATTAADEKDNTRGIPVAVFIENVEAYVKPRGGPEAVLRELHNLYGKYKFMEGRLVQQKKALLTKIPDISNALEVLKTIIAKKAQNKEMTTTYQLSDAIFAKAKIKPTVNTVNLWLGANVMLEYDFKEAEQLLTTNLKNAEVNLASLSKDLVFLKDQITVSEVNIARCHNYRVKINQEAKARAAAGAAK